jgi:hypothetical protein
VMQKVYRNRDHQNRWGYVKHIPDRQGDRHNVDAP